MSSVDRRCTGHTLDQGWLTVFFQKAQSIIISEPCHWKSNVRGKVCFLSLSSWAGWMLWQWSTAGVMLCVLWYSFNLALSFHEASLGPKPHYFEEAQATRRCHRKVFRMTVPANLCLPPASCVKLNLCTIIPDPSFETAAGLRHPGNPMAEIIHS